VPLSRKNTLLDKLVAFIAADLRRTLCFICKHLQVFLLCSVIKKTQFEFYARAKVSFHPVWYSSLRVSKTYQQIPPIDGKL